MRKVIFVNRFFYPDQSATSQILSDLLFNISQKIQLDVHVIASRSTYEKTQRLKRYEEKGGVKIHRVWTTDFGRGGLAGRALDYLSFYASTFIYLLILVKKKDIVVAKTDPPVISFVAYIVVKLKQAYLINWIQDLFPDVAGALGVLKKKSLLYYLLVKLKNASIKSAVMNVVIGDKMSELLQSQGVPRDKVKVIHNWNVNTNINYVPKDQNGLVEEWGLKGKFVVGYSGNFGRAHVYEPVKQLVKYYSKHESLVFLFIGGGKYYNDLKCFVEESYINNVIFKSYQDKEKLNESLSVADVHLISLKPQLEGMIVPSKFYGLASLGVPMVFIGDEGGEIGKILIGRKAGFVVNSNDINKLKEVIYELKGKKEVLEEVSDNIKYVFNENYLPEYSYRLWQEILHESFDL